MTADDGLFEKLDANNDGVLSRQEFEGGLRAGMLQGQKTGDAAVMDQILTGEGGLTELCQVQWSLIREQISNISRELGALRQDINTLRFADSQSELQQNELSRHMREMQASFRRDLAAEGAQRQQLETHFEASVREITDIELSKLSVALESTRTESVSIEKRVQSSIIELDRVVQEAKRELHARAGSTEEAFSKRALGDADLFNELRRLVEESHSKHNQRTAVETELRKELQKLTDALESQEKLHSSSMSSLQNTVRAQQQKAIDASMEPLRLSFSEFASNSKSDMALLADAHKKLQAMHSVAESGRSSDSSKTAAALETLERGLMEQLEGRLSSHSEEHSKRHADLREMLESVAASHRDGMQSHRDGMQSSMEEWAATLKSELAAHGAGLEEHRGQFQDHMTSHSNRLTKRLEELEAKFGDQIDSLVDSHGERHTDFEQRLALHRTELQRTKSQHLEAHEAHAGSVQSALGDLAETLRRDFDTHVSNLTTKHEDLHERLSRDKQGFESTHSEISDRLSDAERRLQDALNQLATDHEEHRNTMSNSVEVLERELLEKLMGHADEHQSHRQDMKGSLAKVAQEHYDKFGELHAMQQQHAEAHKVAQQEHADATNSILESMEERLRGHLDSHRADSAEAHGTMRDSVDELDRKLKEAMSQIELKHGQMDEMHRKHKDALSQLSLDHETKHSSSKSTLSGLEQKLREELNALATEHHTRHSDVKDQLSKHASDTFAKHAELKDHISNLTKTSQERMREEHTGALSAFEARLKREMMEHKADWDTHHTGIRETLNKERQDREALHGGVVQRIEEVDKRVKEAMSRVVEEHEAKHTSMHSTLGALERRLREELDQVQGAAQSDRHSQQAQLRDQVARACSELRAELQDIVTKVSVQDKSARDEYRNSLMMAVESLETRLRREMANHKTGHEETFENILQDRKTLERSFALITDRLAELEARLSAEFSQAAITRDASGNELREVIAAAIEREREQAEQRANAMSLQISTLSDQVQRQMEQERAGREVHQESLRVYLTQDRAARDDAQRILQERLEKAESAFSAQMGDQVSIFLPRQEFEQSVMRIESVNRQEMQQEFNKVWEYAESISAKVQEMASPTEVGKKPRTQLALPAPEQSITVAPSGSSHPGSVSAPPPSPAPVLEAVTPPAPAAGVYGPPVTLPMPVAQVAVSPMRQIFMPMERRSYSPMTRVIGATTVSVGPSRVISSTTTTAGAMEKVRRAEEPPAMATAIVTGVDRNRDGIPDILQGNMVASGTTAAAATTTATTTTAVRGRSFEATPMATVDIKLSDDARATVTGVDRNNDGIPDVLQQGQTVNLQPMVQSSNPSYSPAPVVRPARVMPPVVTSSLRQESGGRRTTNNNESTGEYSAVETEDFDYVCGPAQFQGKPAISATPPRLMRSVP